MARIRNVKPEFFTDADLCEHTPLERLLFEGLWCFADRDGRLEDRPRELKVKLLPYDDCNVDEMLTNLSRPKPGRDFGFVRRYAVNGKRYLQVEKLGEHQKFHPSEKPRGYPAPPEFDVSAAAEPAKPAASTPQPSAGTSSNTAQPPAEQSSAGVQQVASRPETETDVSETDVSDLEALSTSSTRIGREELLAAMADATDLAPPAETPLAPKAVKRLIAAAADDVFAHWRDTLRKGSPRLIFDDERKARVKARLKEGYTVEDLKRAIDGCGQTPHNMGKNDRHEKYDDLELICRNAAHVDRFMANAKQGAPAAESPPAGYSGTPAGAAWEYVLQGFEAQGMSYAASQLRKLTPVSLQADVLKLESPDALFADWIEHECGEVLRSVEEYRIELLAPQAAEAVG